MKSTTCRASRDVTWRAVSCVLRRACSNMADDEEAVMIACKNDILFYYMYYSLFQLTNEINSFSETNCGDQNFIYITN